MGYVVQEEDGTKQGQSQIRADSLSEELVKRALDSSQNEISFLRDLTKKFEVKIDSQKAKISKLRTKNTALKAKYSSQEEELVEKRVEIARLKAAKSVDDTIFEKARESLAQQQSLDEARTEIALLKTKLQESIDEMKDMKMVEESKEMSVNEYKGEVSTLKALIEGYKKERMSSQAMISQL